MAAVYKYNSINKLSVQIDRTNGFRAKQPDDFCWSCHRDKPTLFCTSCIRSYHAAQFCSGVKKLSADEKRSWKCPVCIDIQTDLQRTHTKNIDAKDVSKMLSLVLERIKSDENFTDALLNIDYSQISQRVAKPMDISAIEQNIDDFVYRCYEAFLSDIKWIVHNIKVYTQLVFRGKVNAAKVVKWLMDMTKEEIYSIRMCHECYIGLVQKHRFDVVCKQPHIIVWAKQKGYPYWPAKLMSVNAAKNTVEVRYFGEKHFRAVIAPKDCYMYSVERPSLHLGTRKKAFEKAQAETDSYIKRISEVYGSYNLAAANTPLNASKLERHLYDTIPNAWITLGKTTAPPPIPTVLDAAAARIPRRHSIASRSAIASSQSKPPILPNPVKASRIMTRRSSSRINSMNEYDDDQSEFDSVKKSSKVFQRRQSVQVDMITSGKRNFWNDTDTHGDRISSLSSTSKKRKFSIDDDGTASNLGNNKTKQTTSKSANESIFKVPAIPRKVRKLSTAAQEMTTLHENMDTTPSNHNSTAAPASPSKESNAMSNGQNDNQPESKIGTNAKHLPEIDALFNTFIEDNTSEMTDCIQSMMNKMLHKFYDTNQPTQSELQNVQNQLITMQSDYTRQIDQLKRENNTLTQKLNTMTGKYEAQSVKVRDAMQKNAELKGGQSEAKLKMAALTMDLKKAVDSNAELTWSSKEISKQNEEYESTIAKLKTQHESAQKLLIEAELKATQFEADNRLLTEKNTGLNKSLQWAVKQYQDTLARLKHVQTTCNLEKSTAYEQCCRIINDNKKKQWCTVCQKEGGRYYCSRKCEDKYWKRQ